MSEKNLSRALYYLLGRPISQIASDEQLLSITVNGTRKGHMDLERAIWQFLISFEASAVVKLFLMNPGGP